MDYLITKNESCIDKIDKNYNTPLLMSCYFNNKKMIKYLIRYSNINIQNNYQDSSLIISCYFDNSTIVGYLIEKNANEYLKNIYGDICFSIAKKLKNENSLKKLEEKIKNFNSIREECAKLNINDNDGRETLKRNENRDNDNEILSESDSESNISLTESVNSSEFER
ncbi:hypothetical protein U3516DRAFT_829398 [Neocallimastix sp. 'constans']